MLFVQGGIVGAHQDKPDLACSASKSELVASCRRFHDVVNIGESLDAGGRHVAVDIWDLQKKAEAVTDRVRLRSLLPRSRDKQQQAPPHKRRTRRFRGLRLLISPSDLGPLLSCTTISLLRLHDTLRYCGDLAYTKALHSIEFDSSLHVHLEKPTCKSEVMISSTQTTKHHLQLPEKCSRAPEGWVAVYGFIIRRALFGPVCSRRTKPGGTTQV